MLRRQSLTSGILSYSSNYVRGEDYATCKTQFQIMRGGLLSAVCIGGLPSMGKSQTASVLAKEWQFEQKQRYNTTLTVRLMCASEEDFTNSVIRLFKDVTGKKLQLADDVTIYEVFREILQDISVTRFNKFLIVFDDVKLQDVWSTVKWMADGAFSNKDKCHVICTVNSANIDAATSHCCKVITLKGFKRLEDAKKLLEDLGRDRSDEELIRLIEVLDGHPAALIEAGEDYLYSDRSGDFVECYIQENRDTGRSVHKLVGNVLKFLGDDHQELLSVISNFSENRIPHYLLHISQEALLAHDLYDDIDGKVGRKIREKVRAFLRNINDVFYLGTMESINFYNIKTVVKDAMQQQISSSDNDKTKYVSVALNAINCTMAREESMVDDTERNNDLFPHAKTLLKTLKSFNFQENGDLYQQISHIDLITTVAMCYLCNHLLQKAKSYIDHAADYACQVFGGYNSLIYLEGIVNNGPKAVALELANKWKEKRDKGLSEDFKSSVRNFQMLQKISERQMQCLKVKKRDVFYTDHLSAKVLKTLRTNGAALDENLMVEVYPYEKLARVFRTRAQIYRCLSENSSDENALFFNTSYSSGVIAHAILEHTADQYRIPLLDKVVVNRTSLLNYRAKRRDVQQSFPLLEETKNICTELQEETECPHFRMGLQQAGEDSSEHEVNVEECLLTQILVKGHTCERRFRLDMANWECHYQAGEELFKKILEDADRRNDWPPVRRANAHQVHGEFLRLCAKTSESVNEFVKATGIKFPFNDDRRVPYSYFYQMCTNIKNCQDERRMVVITFDDENTDYLGKLLNVCPDIPNETREMLEAMLGAQYPDVQEETGQ